MKKIIKKKLDKMTEEEIEQVRKRNCANYPECYYCPLLYKNSCIALYFHDWKRRIEDNKDKEFEIEVEE